MKRRVLNVDEPASWENFYKPFFHSLASPEIRTHLYDPERFSSAHARLAALAHLAAPPRKRKDKWLRKRALDCLERNFSHCACYHSCRIRDEDSYRRHGLLPADLDLLDRQAENLFGISEALSRAIKTARREGYRAHNQGGVFLFFARSGAAHIGDHYLRHGSEYLACIAGALGPEQSTMLGTQGRPAIVRCELSLTELGEHARCAAILPLIETLTVRDELAPPGFYAVPGGFKYEGIIPPDRIEIEFVDPASV